MKMLIDRNGTDTSELLRSITSMFMSFEMETILKYFYFDKTSPKIVDTLPH